jgi:hypothetical protein
MQIDVLWSDNPDRQRIVIVKATFERAGFTRLLARWAASNSKLAHMNLK